MKYLLDTNICIALLKKDGVKGDDTFLKEKLISFSPTEFVLCSVVKAELIYGARNSSRIEQNLNLLGTFFSQFVSFPFDDKAAEFYGVNRTILKSQGKPVGENDLLISSIALARDLAVVTRNITEFSRIPALKIEIW